MSGTWNIIKRGDTDATVSINIFVNGKHHVSFGGPVQQTPVEDATVAVAVPTQAGDLTISLTGDALSYTILDYSLPGLSCESVTYTGSLGR